MRFHHILLFLALTGCVSRPTAYLPSPPPQTITSLPKPIQCVPFVREISGIEIFGDAWTWWDKAQGRYVTGRAPMPGAVLVLSRDDRLRYGHVAMVARQLDSRRITVTHANWGSNENDRRLIRDNHLAVDVSPRNDWSQLRFWNDQTRAFGRIYPASGFIYPIRPGQRLSLDNRVIPAY